jgi:hypothetical protein
MTTITLDDKGRALGGSELQVQIYVNRREEEINAALCAALPDLGAASPDIRWTSPLEAKKFAEHQDGDFLDSVGYGLQAGALKDYWPKNGPCWDGLAMVYSDSLERPGVLLLDSASSVDDLAGETCQSKAVTRNRVKKAMREAREWLREQGALTLDEEEQVDPWLGQHFQTAARLSHMVWVRQILEAPCWFANLLFTEDDDTPTSEADFAAGVSAVNAELGLADTVPGYANVILPSQERSELL